jgi:MFS family permease
MIGPLLAFVILLLIPGAFDVVFVASFSAALIGLGVIVLFVRDIPIARSQGDGQPALTMRDGLAVLRRPAFRRVIVVGSALALLTISDAFIYLILQRRFDFPIQFFPLLFVGTALGYMILAVPFGRLADRYGRAVVYLAGYGALALVYASLLLPALGPAQLIATMALLGAYYAMTDGVLAALASGVLPEKVRATGLGLLAGSTNLMRLFASVLFGLAWTLWDISGAVAVYLVALILVAGIGATFLIRPAAGHSDG